MSTLELVEVDDDEVWDAGVSASAQGTVFSRSAHLRALGEPFRRLAVRDRGRLVALLPVVEDASGQRMVQPPFTPYQGVLFQHDAALLPRQRVLDEFRIGEFVVEALAQRYREIAMPLSWMHQDLRPFLWHNYHAEGAPRFAVQPRYTALLDLRTLDAANYPGQVRALRRRELRKAADCSISEAPEVDRFLALYAQTFARQEIALAQATLDRVRRITEAALDQGYGRLSACITPQGVASMDLFVYDHRRAYYLFGANDPALRNTGAATRLMFDNIAEAKRRGLDEFDFVGVNSPNRGDFKLSFNPELALYFELRLAAA